MLVTTGSVHCRARVHEDDVYEDDVYEDAANFAHVTVLSLEFLVHVYIIIGAQDQISHARHVHARALTSKKARSLANST